VIAPRHPGKRLWPGAQARGAGVVVNDEATVLL